MRAALKKQTENFIQVIKKAHKVLGEAIDACNSQTALQLLEECQSGAISLGTSIEESEGEGFVTIGILEEYCEIVYQTYEALSQNHFVDTGKVCKSLNDTIIRAWDSMKDMPVRKEVVFLPYKASMWDSLESVWMAADADPECDAYVIPIPYYDKDPQGNLKVYHYEGDDFPEYVPITHYENYPLEEIHPDVIYIHNPYDHGNYVTSVHPRFYSYELKKYTNLLVYIPYYATSGGMSEGQALCSAYAHVDYIVLQAEKYEKFIDSSVPREKILALGSPKFDRVLRLCKNPPPPPNLWKEKMAGKKVYFYNTSINGMLADTRKFLLKMEYVFKCFQGREDACLLWRPHPLLESTFDSMRKPYRPFYDELKSFFIKNNLGIYDDTTDMEKTIALCDAYVGDSGTSLTSLFGLAGKPMFILNNNIHTLPQEDDWRGEIIKTYFADGFDRWRVVQGNKLYYSPANDYQYEFYCNLSGYAVGDYYQKAIEAGGKVYVCPQNAQDILVVENHKIIKRIALERKVEREGAFALSWLIGNYLYLIPFAYPAIVRYDTIKDKVDYIEGYNEIFIRTINGEKHIGGSCVWNNYLMIASPSDDKVLVIDSESMEVQLLFNGTGDERGSMSMVVDGNDIWLLPYSGTKVSCWRPETGERKEYAKLPEGFRCKQRPLGFECMDRPFGRVASYQNYIVLAPYWGNMFVRINKESGKVQPWEPLADIKKEPKNSYYNSWMTASFIRQIDGPIFLLYHETWRKLYEINIETGESREIEIFFDEKELVQHTEGFSEVSEWLQYACIENAFHTLPQFLAGELPGESHDIERQKTAYALIASNGDGTAGEKIYQFIKTKL